MLLPIFVLTTLFNIISNVKYSRAWNFIIHFICSVKSGFFSNTLYLYLLIFLIIIIPKGWK